MFRDPLPAPTPGINAGYQQLVAEIDRAVVKLSEKRFTDKLRCVPGCSSCCTAFSVLPLEAVQLIRALSAREGALPENRDRCRLLVDNLCAVYPHRPVICRTQGMPVAYVDEAGGGIEVSACPVNFADDYHFVLEDLLFLDRFNSRLTELNRRYCRAAGLDPQMRLPITLLTTSV